MKVSETDFTLFFPSYFCLCTPTVGSVLLISYSASDTIVDTPIRVNRTSRKLY